FVKHEKTYASLEAGDEVFDIGLNRAVTLIAEKVAKGPSGRRFGADPGKALGDHPSLGGVAVKNGRYGAYVTAGGVNATIPSDKTPDTITIAEAIALIDERAAKGGGKPKRGARKAAAKKSAPKKAAAKAADPDAPKPAKKAAPKKAAAKPKSDAVTKARSPNAGAKSTSPPPCPRPWSPTSPAATPTANCSPLPPNGTRKKTAPRQKSAFTFRVARSREQLPASATAH